MGVWQGRIAFWHLPLLSLLSLSFLHWWRAHPPTNVRRRNAAGLLPENTPWRANAGNFVEEIPNTAGLSLRPLRAIDPRSRINPHANRNLPVSFVAKRRFRYWQQRKRSNSLLSQLATSRNRPNTPTTYRLSSRISSSQTVKLIIRPHFAPHP